MTTIGHRRWLPLALPLAVAAVTWPVIASEAPTTTPAATVTAAPVTAAPTPAVPSPTAIEAPVSLSDPARGAAAVPSGTEARVVRTASNQAIPSAALAAYQRAASVINSADESCALGWPLVAAIGRVESDHGRVDGNQLDDEGVARPGIYGVPLDGTDDHGTPTRAVPDTDAGQYDNDTVWDRAVGPMQFIPSTWSVVGVDADGDGVRNPQDIDDAALAAAVYLCSGTEDLSTDAGQRTALARYNHSEKYVDLVLQVTAAYEAGNYTPAPNMALTARAILPTDLPEPTAAKGGYGLFVHEPAPTRESILTEWKGDAALLSEAPATEAESDAEEVVEEPGTGGTVKPDPTPSPEPEPTPDPEPSPDPSPEPEPEPSPDPEPSPEPTPEPEECEPADDGADPSTDGDQDEDETDQPCDEGEDEESDDDAAKEPSARREG